MKPRRLTRSRELTPAAWKGDYQVESEMNIKQEVSAKNAPDFHD